MSNLYRTIFTKLFWLAFSQEELWAAEFGIWSQVDPAESAPWRFTFERGEKRPWWTYTPDGSVVFKAPNLVHALLVSANDHLKCEDDARRAIGFRFHALAKSCSEKTWRRLVESRPWLRRLDRLVGGIPFPVPPLAAMGRAR